METTAEQKLQMIAARMRKQLDSEGCVCLDENLGDVAETYQAILWLCTEGKEGTSWGIFE